MNTKRGFAIAGLVFCFLTVASIFWNALPAKDTSLSFAEQLEQKMTFKIGFDESGKIATLRQVCEDKSIAFPPKNTGIVVDKSDFKLHLYAGDNLLKTYPVTLGRDPVSDKQVEGDLCTPEGDFYICDRSWKPQKKDIGARWLRLSYPNIENAKRGLKAHLVGPAVADSIIEAINNKEIPEQGSKLGGGIGIHGGWPSALGLTVNNWTAGCIGMHDPDIIELYDVVSIGTPVLIKK